MSKIFLFVIFCTVLSLPTVLGFGKNLRLGGLFHDKDPCQQAFVASIDAVNSLRHRNHELVNILFHADWYDIDNDIFKTGERVCHFLKTKVAAIFGPTDKKSAEHVQSICETVDIPNIVARLDTEPIRMRAFNFFPHAETLSKIFVRIVTDYHWKSYTILYEGSESLVRINELLKKYNPKGHTVTIRHLGNQTDFREILFAVRQSLDENIVIDCSYEILEKVLRQCQQVGLMSENYKILVTNLDLHTIDLEPYQYSGVNLTGVRLVDINYSDPEGIFNDFLDQMYHDDITQLRVQSALMYDAVHFFSRAFKRALRAKNDDTKSLRCDGTDYWDYGSILSNYLRSTEMRGLTGWIKFNNDGFRDDFELEIVSLHREGLKRIGVYNNTQQEEIHWYLKEDFVSLAEKSGLSNRTFRVLIALVPPYNMLTKSTATQSGNDRYEGFAIDIIHEISKLLHFNYTFIETDPDYGKMIDNVTNKWSGMIGKIMEGEADLAITDLTITAERERVVEFTHPFMNLGISILYRKPTKAAPDFFSFLSPFSINVWIYLLAAYISCSFLLFIIGRMSPKEWTNPYPCIDEPEELQNQFTLKNSLWFMSGAIMQQGSEIAPIGISTRMLASAWWFFCLIIVSSYTANLAAFLVVETNVKLIKSAEDLANMNGAIKYGAKKNGATANFFKTYAESQVNGYSIYEKMHQYMEENSADVMPETNEQGIDKVRDINQNYAFLMESSSIHYIMQRECNLTQIGGLLDAKGYGIAMPKSAPYLSSINDAVLQLQESGVISRLQKKWWEEKHGGGECRGEQPTVASKLTLDHVGGVFVVLGMGVAFSVPIAFWEFIWKVACAAYKENVSFKEEFVEEIRSIVKAKSSVKPVRRRKESSGIMDSSTRGSTPAFGFSPTIIKTSSEMP